MLLAVVFIIFITGIAPVASQVPPFTEECVSGAYPPKTHEVPTYVINLDLPANQRWAQIGKIKSPEIAALLKTFKDFIRGFGNGSKVLIDLVDKDLGYLADTFPAPFDDELKGLALASGLPLGEIVLYNVFYEVFTVCTSIVAQNAEGRLFHARNLDFGLFMGWDVKTHTWMVAEKLRPMVMNLDYQRSGKTVFKSVNFAGYIGILTGIKPGIFTLTMNERFDLLDGGYIGIIEWILGKRNGQWMGFLTRNVLENAGSYTQAKDKLSNTPMLAPAYYILGGNQSGEGCVITRSRQKAVDIWNLNAANGTWYVVETNYDHWKKPFFLDNRRKPAHKCMDKVTQKNIDISSLFDVLSSKPVLNKLTVYSTLMQVNSGAMETYLQLCKDPCWLW